jgi:acyl-coenzyme A synthetase/AMP-(fatty) acid ligase
MRWHILDRLPRTPTGKLVRDTTVLRDTAAPRDTTVVRDTAAPLAVITTPTAAG